MNALPLGLMLLSASFHATWNLLLKRSDNQEAFVLGIVVSGSVMFVPLGIVLFWLYPADPSGYLFALVSTGFQSFYFVMLSRAYSKGDLSLIYPVARGIGPMLVPVLAVPILGETVAWPAVVGIVLIVGGIYVVSWWGRFRQIIAKPSRLLRERSVGFAVLAGMAIAGYSLVDKRGVEHVQPFLYMYIQTVGGAIALAPYVVRRHGLASVGLEWENEHPGSFGSGAAGLCRLRASVDGILPGAGQLHGSRSGVRNSDRGAIGSLRAEGIVWQRPNTGVGIHRRGVGVDCAVPLGSRRFALGEVSRLTGQRLVYLFTFNGGEGLFEHVLLDEDAAGSDGDAEKGTGVAGVEAKWNAVVGEEAAPHFGDYLVGGGGY